MEVRAPWHNPSYFSLPCRHDVSKLITFLIPQTTHILTTTTKSIMPHLERVPSEYSFPTPNIRSSIMSHITFKMCQFVMIIYLRDYHYDFYLDIYVLWSFYGVLWLTYTTFQNLCLTDHFFGRLLMNQDISPNWMVPGGNNGVIRPGRCGAQSAVLGPKGREMKFSKKF